MPWLLCLQLGFEVSADFVEGFGKDGQVDEHQFSTCISECHKDTRKHPKSKQIFTLMDGSRKGVIGLKDFTELYTETNDALRLQRPQDQRMLHDFMEQDVGCATIFLSGAPHPMHVSSHTACPM
ncbi:hypothetical protein OAN61_01165 [bacterium]|nr:hypothetical protein [bacterium]